MTPRLQSTAVLAFMVLVLYLLFARSYGSNGIGEHVIDTAQENLGIGFAPPGSGNPPATAHTPGPTPFSKDYPAFNPDQPNPDDWKAPGAPAEEQLDPAFGDEPEIPELEPPRPKSTRTRHSRPQKATHTAYPEDLEVPPADSVVTQTPPGSKQTTSTDTPVTDVDGQSTLQEEFEEESGILQSEDGVDAIYGTTLQNLNDTGAHEGFKAAALTATDFWPTYSDARPYVYNPYPDYNSKSWKQASRGIYKSCMGPKGEVADLKVYSGHPDIFGEPLIGSYIPLDIDSNLCFERETRLGPYGFSERSSANAAPSADELGDGDIEERDDVDVADWGLLQRVCFKKNANRFKSVLQHQQIIDHVNGTKTSSRLNSTRKAEVLETRQGEEFEEGVVEEEENNENENEDAKASLSGLMEEVDGFDAQDIDSNHLKYKPAVVTPEEQETEALKYAMPTVQNGDKEEFDPDSDDTPLSIEDKELLAQKQIDEMIEEKSRTAVLIRSFVGQKYSDNDKQNIRAMISELCLRSGGEYQIFLLVQVKDNTIPISDPRTYDKVVQENIPKEFWNLTVLWNDSEMKQLYPTIPAEVNNVHQSQWLSVQKFAQDHPEFAFFWNWEFDVRYTGHYYNLLDKLDSFAKAQPRKYLWERNERYYIPSFHGRYSKFLKTVEKISGYDTIWGPPAHPDILPTGPPKKSAEIQDDNYKWGKGEAADYISLAPIFNPVNTSWVGRDDVWGYDGVNTPRRATIGTTSRCSRKLLDTMHNENLKGNHVSSEMTPPTVSLLHGLKAVFAPIPMFFDKPWSGKSLEKYFNPGPKGVSGSSPESAFSWGKESRFAGSTWYFRAVPPMRLYNNWLGWPDHDIGGLEWEKEHGRICLPPMLLHPIKDVVEHELGYASESELPY